jgi:hypothetical protein
MDSRLSGDNIKSYSVSFAERVCDKFFQSRLKISGKDILTVTPEKQINLFVLKNLFKIWEKENEKLKSPYFDYDAPEVKTALENFLNTLSQHIYISRNDFEPLLVQSVFDALVLILSPYDFYRMELSSNKVVSVVELKKMSRYIQVNKHLLSDLIKKMELKDIPELDNKNALFLFDQVCEQSTASPDDIEEHFKVLGQIKPLRSEDFYTTEEKVFAQQAAHEVRQKEPESSNKKILAETFVVNAQTINEKFEQESKASLAEKLQKSRIQSIKTSLPINQKFVYINNLFNGSIQDFAEAADRIDECRDLNEVKRLIENTFLPKYHWNPNDEIFKEFEEVVERRFI